MRQKFSKAQTNEAKAPKVINDIKRESARSRTDQLFQTSIEQQTSERMALQRQENELRLKLLEMRQRNLLIEQARNNNGLFSSSEASTTGPKINF